MMRAAVASFVACVLAALAGCGEGNGHDSSPSADGGAGSAGMGGGAGTAGLGGIGGDSGTSGGTGGSAGEDASAGSAGVAGSSGGTAGSAGQGGDGAGLKWYPGHYEFIPYRSSGGYLEENNTEVVQAANAISAYPVVRGLQVRYVWKELEPEAKGQYRFDKILADSDVLASKGKYLIVQVNHKTFAIGQNVVPPYMETEEYGGGQIAHGGQGDSGWVMRWWEPKVQERHKALLTAMAGAIDGRPNIVLVNVNETAVNRPPDTPDWTEWVEAGRDYFGNPGRFMRPLFVRTPTVSYINAFPGWFSVFEATANDTGHGLGGPDIDPYGIAENTWIAPSYLLMQSMAAKIPTMLAVQWPDYPSVYEQGGDAGTFFWFGRDLGLNFLVWQQRDPYSSDVKMLWESLPAEYPGDPAGGLKADCPELLAPCASEQD